METKTVVLIVIVIIIAFFGLKSVYKLLTGKGGCDCGGEHTDGEHKCCGGCASCGEHHHEDEK